MRSIACLDKYGSNGGERERVPVNLVGKAVELLVFILNVGTTDSTVLMQIKTDRISAVVIYYPLSRIDGWPSS